MSRVPEGESGKGTGFVVKQELAEAGVLPELLEESPRGVSCPRYAAEVPLPRVWMASTESSWESLALRDIGTID